MKTTWVLGVLLTLFTTPALAESLYRWVDSQGKVHFSDQPPPPKAARKLEEVKLPKPGTSDPAVPYVLQQAVKNHPVTLYLIANCGPCKDGVALLNKRGIPFAGKDPQKDPKLREEIQKLLGRQEVPILIVGKATPVTGFDEGQWNSVLDDAGYPKAGSIPLPARKAEPPQQSETPAQEGVPAPPASEAPRSQP
jgi:glutaredoxin